MKNKIILFLLSISFVQAQNITITPDGITPLIEGSEYQRLSYDEITALPSPLAGDMAYDLTFKCMRFYDGNQWACSYQSPHNKTADLALVTSLGGPSLDSSADLIIDEDGNLLTTGYYTDSLIIGDTILNAQSNSQDIYLAKFMKSGQLLWAKSFGGDGFDLPSDIHIDQNGHILMTGLFEGNTSFESTVISSAGNYDGFLAKFDSEGTLIWVKPFGGADYDTGVSLVSDNSTNIFITGNFSGTATFDAVSKTSQNGQDIFLAKFNDSGNIQWIVAAGGNDTDRSKKVLLTSENKLLLLGEFASDISLGSTSFTSLGSYDVFKVTYDPILLEWVNASQYGSTGEVGLAQAVLDSSDNLYVAGSFKNTLSINPLSKNSEGDYDTFVSKILANGTVAFLKSFGSSSLDKSSSLVVKENGELFLSGYFTQTGNFEGVQKFNKGIYDVFILKLSSSGSLTWVLSFGANGAEINRAMIKNNTGDIFGTVSFEGSFNLGNSYVTRVASSTDIFIFRLNE